MNPTEMNCIDILREYCDTLTKYPEYYRFKDMRYEILTLCIQISDKDFSLTPELTVKGLKEITIDILEYNMTQEVFIEAISCYVSDPYVTKNVIHNLQRCEKVLKFLLENESITQEEIKRRMTMLRPIFNSLCEEIDGDFTFDLTDFRVTRNMLEDIYHIYDNINCDIFAPRAFRREILSMNRDDIY